MSDLLLAKPNLPEGWIDTTIGEAHLVRDNLLKVFHLQDNLKVGYLKESDLIYPDPAGFKPLVQHLEDKHKAPVIITNGAKQGLSASLFLLKKNGYDYCGMKTPYWALIPPLATIHGIDMINLSKPNVQDNLPFLLLSPNNPDGHCESAEELVSLSKQFKDSKLPLLHDAVYYNHIYLPATHTLPPIGDLQIFSISKMFGLSGLRLGYIVCHNHDYYKVIREYIETMTVGVSVSSQTWIHNLMAHQMKSYPSTLQAFEGACSVELEQNKKLCLQINPDVLEVPTNLVDIPGMFLWGRVGPKADFQKARINVVDGSNFGGPGMVRINLALHTEQIKEMVERLNNI